MHDAALYARGVRNHGEGKTRRVRDQRRRAGKRDGDSRRADRRHQILIAGRGRRADVAVQGPGPGVAATRTMDAMSSPSSQGRRWLDQSHTALSDRHSRRSGEKMYRFQREENTRTMREKMLRRSFLKSAALATGAVTVMARAAQPVSATTAWKPMHGAAGFPPVGTGPARLNVRDFGAKGDGATKDTAALQQALDRCAVLGGGEVLIPAGNYLTGAIQIRSNTLLRFEKDTILTGSSDMAEYPVTTVRWEGRWIQGHIALIYAIDASSIGIVVTRPYRGQSRARRPPKPHDLHRRTQLPPSRSHRVPALRRHPPQGFFDRLPAHLERPPHQLPQHPD